MAKGREEWTSRAGFLLAAIGSAIGLANMWRFPYLTAKHGGAAFVVLYITIAVLISMPVLLAEFAIGRGAKCSPIPALKHFGGRRWTPLGWWFVATGFGILAFYSVVTGWTLRYTLESLWTGFSGDAAARYHRIATGPDALLWHFAFAAINGAVIWAGIKDGIERLCTVLMPVLFLILIALAIYAGTLPGSGAGYHYYLETDLKHLLSLDVLADAVGQAFFSLSLGMGAMLTYASYLHGGENLPRASLIVAGADFSVAIVGGLVVFPIIFALGLQDSVGESTMGALFITLPRAFARMGSGGTAIGVLFFGVLFVAALASAMSLLEVVVASLMDVLGWSRHRAVVIGSLGATLLGVPAALDMHVLDVMDQIAGNLMLLVGALGLSLFAGWRMPDPVAEASQGTQRIRWWPLWIWLLRYPVPLLLLMMIGSVVLRWFR